MRTFFVGSRGSRLALAQTRQVIKMLDQLGWEGRCLIRVIRTTGDSTSAQPLTEVGGTGVFVKEIEQALLDKEIDFAVHSAKDLPTQSNANLHIAAYPEREEPFDALVSPLGNFEELPPGSRIGTSSPRRRMQLLCARPDLSVIDARGNLDTRLRKLDNGAYDAAVLACAGLRRLGLDSRIAQVLPTEICLPAAGQGALAVQCRAGEDIERALRKLDHQPTRLCVEAEKEVLRRVGAGCQTPIGVLARMIADEISIEAVAALSDGTSLVRVKEVGPRDQSADVAERVAQQLHVSTAASR